MRLGVKGQGIALDLMISVAIFMLLLAGSLAIWSNSATAAERQSREGEMRKMAERALDTLIRSPGEPENWGDLGVGRGGCPALSVVQSFGLAKREKVIDSKKLNRFTRCYPASSVEIRTSVKQRLLIGDNDYYFRVLNPCASSGMEPVLEFSEYHKADAGIHPNDASYTFELIRVKVSRAITIRHQCFGEEEKDHAAIAELTLYRRI